MTAHRSFFKHATESRVDRKRRALAEKEAQEREVHRVVDARDGYRCRVCLARCNPAAIDLLAKAHRHHIVFRSARGVTSTANVVTLCASCHDLTHKHVLDIRGDADAGIEVWGFDEATGWYLVRRETGVFEVERD